MKLKHLLEYVLPPSRLKRGVVHIPTQHRHILKNVFNIVQKRMEGPLRIGVYGDSVTAGRKCLNATTYASVLCARSQRLEVLIKMVSWTWIFRKSCY